MGWFYGFKVETPGLQMLNPLPLNLSGNDTTTGLVFTVTNDGIKTEIGTLGVETHNCASLQMYSNPTKGQLTIDNGELTIKCVEIYDVMGKMQESRKAVNAKRK